MKSEHVILSACLPDRQGAQASEEDALRGVEGCYNLRPMTHVLEKNFFSRPVLEVAPDLLGKILVRKIGQKEIRAVINEVEDADIVIPSTKIERTPRIGVGYAGVNAKKPWRFIITLINPQGG